MNKNIRHLIIFFWAICLLPQFVKGQLSNTGATIVMGSGAYLVVDSLDFQNNGAFIQTAGTVKFTGGINTYLLGDGSSRFYNLELNKTGASLLLQNNIGINNQVLFTAGLLNLNNYNITLDAAALLNGESEISRITCTTGGYVQITSELNAPTAVNPGNLGAVITSAQNMGSTIIRRGHVSQTNGYGGGNSIFRYYDITPANNTSLNATLNYNYFDAELNGLDENLLTVWTSPNSTTWTDILFDARDAVANYVSKTNLGDFARVTLSSPLNALPLEWGSFITKCVNNGMTISWKTLQESNTNAFFIRRSSNGRNWQTIATLAAAGNSNVGINYSYTDAQSFTGAFYRIVEADLNGRVTLSPVLQSNCTVTDAVTVYPNPTYSNCWVSIQTAGRTQVLLRLYDNKGVLVKQQLENVQAGTSQMVLPMNNMAKGMYNLVIRWGNGRIKTVNVEKL